VSRGAPSFGRSVSGRDVEHALAGAAGHAARAGIREESFAVVAGARGARARHLYCADEAPLIRREGALTDGRVYAAQAAAVRRALVDGDAVGDAHAGSIVARGRELMGCWRPSTRRMPRAEAPARTDSESAA